MNTPDDARVSPKDSRKPGARFAFTGACLSLALAVTLATLIPHRQPDHPAIVVIPGLGAVLGFALGICAFRRGTWRVNLIAAWAILWHEIILIATAYAIYLLW